MTSTSVKKRKSRKNEQPEQKNASQPVSASFPPLFSQLEAINSATHQALYYHPVTKDDFARKTHALPLVLQEITAAALDTPVLFIRGGVHHFDGFFVVDREVLKALPIEKLTQLRDADLLEPVYAHLLSLQHLPALMQQAEKQEQQEQTLLKKTEFH
ncbi:SapC family protein [Yersinia ruckeri]|uniref:SapC family protein n=1 Tax=Yersinia ruckeri TaxID=29486 RepID=UPI001F22A080|nr:SapC family protein [Yersinia ruckeri]UIN02587.1 SapC family protein [Yersinia ruckeri]